MKLLTKEEVKLAMETYKFECRKSKERWGSRHYTKKYTFTVPPSIYETFNENTLNLKIHEDTCELSLRLRFGTNRAKDGIIWPVLNIFYDLLPKPGDKLVKDEDEAIMLLDKCFDHLAQKREEYKSDRIRTQKNTIRNLIDASIDQECSTQRLENKALNALSKELNALRQQQNDVRNEIYEKTRKDIYKELFKKKTLEYSRFTDQLCGEKFPKEIVMEVVKEYKPLTEKEKKALHTDTK